MERRASPPVGLRSSLSSKAQKKKQSTPAKKERLARQRFMLRLHQSRGIQPICEKSMKYCPNYSCVAYGRVTYTQATRCAFCRWDLKPPRMKSETLTEQQIHPASEEKPRSSQSRSTARVGLQLKRGLLPRTA